MVNNPFLGYCGLHAENLLLNVHSGGSARLSDDPVVWILVQHFGIALPQQASERKKFFAWKSLAHVNHPSEYYKF
jgi:hypothetical protein